MECHKSWPWQTPNIDWQQVQKLSAGLGIHRLTAAYLWQRGLREPEDASRYLNCQLSELADPFLMLGVREAADRLQIAVGQREPVLICGDYDADGVTSVALLVRVLQKLAVPVEYYIPSRLIEGYGLQESALTDFAARGGKLAISVDCGINSFAEMAHAKSLDIDLIVTDHHECFEGDRSSALAVLNPKQSDCHYPEKNLAGVGVAWTLVRALHSLLGVPMAETANYLEWVAVGTIADVVSLQGENRILVRHGLETLHKNPSAGMKALMEICSIADVKTTAIQVAFTIAPRLNAPGRIGDATQAVRALLADESNAQMLAGLLDEQNRQRQQVEKKILEQAREMANDRPHDKALVLWHQDWHAGVVGIVAGKLASEFDRPTALIAMGEDVGLGSIRTVPGYNIVEALQECKDQLLRFGGHPEAAGFTVAKNDAEEFRAAFCHAIGVQTRQEKIIYLTAEAEPAELSLELLAQLSVLEPFGQGNPEPLFLLKNVDVVSARAVGAKKNHLQLRLQKNSPILSAIHFGGGEAVLNTGESLDVVTTLAQNTWQGRSSLSLLVRDWQRAGATANCSVIDRRNIGNKDDFLMHLAKDKSVIVWVNTVAAKEKLMAILPKNAQITQLGRDALLGACDILVLYHLPYEQSALEKVLSNVDFNDQPALCLCFGEEEYLLNEQIFAASMPTSDVLKQLAAGQEKEKGPLSLDLARKILNSPVTKYLLSRVEKIFAEISVTKNNSQHDLPAKLQESATYQEDVKRLTLFRSYQDFWRHSSVAEIIDYLEKSNVVIPEGESINGLSRTKRAN